MPALCRYNLGAMLNYIWLGLVVAAVLIGGYHDFVGASTGNLKEMTDNAFDMAKTAVMDIALPLVGVMALWLGIMRLAEKSGLIQVLARIIRPVMQWLFPDVPPDHPAMGSMLMNMAANFLGLANAATPLGLRAMKDLERLNPRSGTATNAMCTFLAINTSSVQLLPVTAVAVLAVSGSVQPYAIIGTSILATSISTIAGITAVKLLEKLPGYRLPPSPVLPKANPEEELDSGDPADATRPNDFTSKPMHRSGIGILILFLAFFIILFIAIAFPDLPRAMFPAVVFKGPVAAAAQTQSWPVRSLNTISLLAVPFLVSFFPLYAALKRVKVYEQFVEGAKEGFQVAITIIPYLVAILVAIGMFRGAGGIEMITDWLRPALRTIGFPPEIVPMCLMRPLSGSGSLGVFTELVKHFGPDSLIARTAGTVFGSTETTFYVVAVYFGAVNIRRTRHAVPAGLIADAAGMVASVVICRMMFT